jgi:hypothetical protein
MYYIGEIVQVRVNGRWYNAEVLDVTRIGVYVYVYDLHSNRNVTNANIR